MYQSTAHYYDLVFADKDYIAESEKVASIIRREVPGASTVLDVACGTGKHAQHLSKWFEVDGIDLHPAFVKIAQQAVPHGTISCGDMRDFDLGKNFDVVTCLFSSIGYVRTLEYLNQTLVCLRKHCEDDGITIVEPWFTPEDWHAGRCKITNVERDDQVLCRMDYSKRQKNISTIQSEYLLGTKDGISRISEEHVLGLFTKEEVLRAFNEAGFSTEYNEEGLCNRGLYIATPR